MTTKVYGDVVAAIPLENGGTKYQKVGVLLQHEKNDASKGPGFSVMLDRWFNPAGLPGHGSVGLSVYWPKPKDNDLHPAKSRRSEVGPGMSEPDPFDQS